MKYTCTVEINLPLAEVVELWNNDRYFKEWQDGFERIEQVSGTPNTQGAKSKIFFGGKRSFELLETILVADLPHEKKGLYEHVHMTNTQTSRFVALGKDKTQYVSEVEYTQFNGFIVKLIARLFPKKFKAQSQKWMDQFKAFAESR